MKDQADTQTDEIFPVKRGRGRPSTGQAKSNAERQKAYRARCKQAVISKTVTHRGVTQNDEPVSYKLWWQDLIGVAQTLRASNEELAEKLRQAQERSLKLNDDVIVLVEQNARLQSLLEASRKACKQFVEDNAVLQGELQKRNVTGNSEPKLEPGKSTVYSPEYFNLSLVRYVKKTGKVSYMQIAVAVMDGLTYRRNVVANDEFHKLVEAVVLQRIKSKG